MKVALIGLPQSGKSTVFGAVTQRPVDPYGAPGVQHAVVRVPDKRLDFLRNLWNPKKYTEATIEFADIPGCAIDDAHGRDEWRRLLPEVRQAELLVVVVRDFVNNAVPARLDRIDPQRDFNDVWDELIFADLDAVTTRVERLEQALRKPTKTHDIEKRELALLQSCSEALESEKPLSSLTHTEEELKLIASFAFLTLKPIVCVRNVSEDHIRDATGLEVDHVRDSFAISAAIEAEIAQLESDDREVFMAELGLDSTARERLIRTCYSAAGLISFLTMGADEVRAWTIREGSTAVQAAGKVHTDLAHGFIRAETIAYDDLVAHKDEKGVKAAGRFRKEGKEYVVQDGDILNILSSA